MMAILTNIGAMSLIIPQLQYHSITRPRSVAKLYTLPELCEAL